MAERTLVDYVLGGMESRWQWPVKHADGFTAGIADLSAWLPGAGNIWIELKALDKWPHRATTPAEFGLEDLQRLFLKFRRGWLFVRVGREYLLFNTYHAVHNVDKPHSTQTVLLAKASQFWRNHVDWAEFTQCLRMGARQ